MKRGVEGFIAEQHRLKERIVELEERASDDAVQIGLVEAINAKLLKENTKLRKELVKVYRDKLESLIFSQSMPERQDWLRGRIWKLEGKCEG